MSPSSCRPSIVCPEHGGTKVLRIVKLQETRNSKLLTPNLSCNCQSFVATKDSVYFNLQFLPALHLTARPSCETRCIEKHFIITIQSVFNEVQPRTACALNLELASVQVLLPTAV